MSISIKDMIRDEAVNTFKEKLKERPKKNKKDEKIFSSTETLIIEQTFNKLFYAKPKIDEELEFLRIKRGNDDKERYGLHASAIITSDNEFCYREQVLSLFFKQAQGENVPIGLKRIFAEGDAIHEKWQRLFLRGGLCTPKDLDRSRFKKKYDLSYTPDASPITIGKKEYVVEIKSMNTFQFSKAKTHPSGVKQLKFYMWLTGIHQGLVLMDDKNTQNFKIVLVTLDEADVEPYIERLEKIQMYKQRFKTKKKMVKGICDHSKCKRALGCNMRDACFNIGMGRIKLNV